MRELDVTDRETAVQVLRLERRAYAVEAQIIGSTALPPLRDTVDTLRQCGERFFGYFQDGRLVGQSPMSGADRRFTFAGWSLTWIGSVKESRAHCSTL
ncbi:hypothetical protein [Geobacillus sp. 46C-IIa]|uniref:hypothetical protein n=1 Tax=Geobacillus sp. 46C-IIa TaxID=1963025 RepID=UPI001CC21D28|nr:hypothetical protein [Geobacillus sp. 46C-IIa]